MSNRKIHCNQNKIWTTKDASEMCIRDRCKIDPDTEDTHPEEKKPGADEHSSGDIFCRRVSVVQRIIHAVHTVLYKIPFVIWIVVPAFSPVIVIINIKWCAVLGEDPLFFLTQPEKHDQYDGSRYQFCLLYTSSSATLLSSTCSTAAFSLDVISGVSTLT